MSKQDFINLDKQTEKLIRESQKNIINNYNGNLQKIKTEIANLFEKYGVVDETTMYKYNRIDILDIFINQTIYDLYKENDKEITSVLTKSFVDTSRSIISIVDKETGKSKLKAISKPVDVAKTINEKMAGLHWKDRTNKYRNDLIYNIQKNVKEGISQGDTYSTMAKRLSKTMDIDINKAKTIVRTETSRVMNQAQKQTLDKVEKSGIKMMKTWNSLSDERVRTSHSILDGKTIPYDEDFITPLGNRGFGPKSIGVAEEDINCRCFLSVEFIE